MGPDKANLWDCLPFYFVVVVVLVFYGPWIHFKSFQARSVYLTTIPGKPPRHLISTWFPFFRQ